MKNILILIYFTCCILCSTALGHTSTCPDKYGYICIQVIGDNSIKNPANVGIHMLAQSLNPLWNEFGFYSDFIDTEKSFSMNIPMEYIVSHQLVYAEYSVTRIENQTILNCVYKRDNITAGSYMMTISQDNDDFFHCSINDSTV